MQKDIIKELVEVSDDCRYSVNLLRNHIYNRYFHKNMEPIHI